ncbi:AAA family ATPase [Archangium sp.]|uniref:AAA family ATPase n=1 Tax=Archangium sp. TaxID=1872627 RepID=UPI002D2D2F3C|nr:AAA family ATPase [Archangium sp.]HYO53692.1 AAA family ATPase [Archangium sp.]
MYIRKIVLENIRGFGESERRVELDLRRPDGSYAGWTVVAGRNGSGKSTLLRGVAMAAAGVDAPLVFQQNPSSWMRRGARSARAAATVVVDEHEDSWDPRELGTPRKEFVAGLELQSRELSMASAAVTQTSWDTTGKNKPKDRWVWLADRGWFMAGYGPHRRLTQRLAAVQQVDIGSPRLTRLAGLFRGELDLAESVEWLKQLHYLSLNDRPGAGQLLEEVKKLLNDGLLPDSAEISEVNPDGLWVNQRGVGLSLWEMSDGYRTVTALVTDLVRLLSEAYQDFRLEQEGGLWRVPYPGVVLVDELEQHLHPSWQKEIGFWFKEHFPHIQFIVTTHSPFVCQAADPNGLIRLPGPDEARGAEHVSEQVYRTVVNGTVDEAVLTELFGLEHAWSKESERIREKVTRLEARLLRDRLSPEERNELDGLVAKLPDTSSEFVDRTLRKYGLNE